MRTVVRRVLLLSALMSPGVLQALGLGDIHLNSALNQPFDAEIELVSATQDDLGALRANLASSDTFVRYGLDRPAFLSEFSFRVTKGAGGKDVLRVTSQRAVTEPFVTLLVEANWSRGRLLREYTVLLDPPVYAPGAADSAAPAVAAPRVTSGGATSARETEETAPEATVPETTAESRPRRAAAPVATRAASIEPGSDYTVRRNDTLWQIASAAHPGPRSDVNRAMLAIYQGNPSAFDGNINVLRSGSTLRIPQSAEVTAISSSAAAAEVARQYDAWRSGRAGAASAAATDAGRLRLVTPEQGTSAPSTATEGPAAAAPTRTTPAAATPAGAAPAASVDARVKQLEAELAEARRLLEVRNAELATLQGGAAAAAQPAAEATAPTAPAEAVTEPVAEPAAAPEKAPVAKDKPPKPTKKAVTEPAGPTLLERVMGYWWLLLALVAALAGAMLFQRMRRERGAAEADLEDVLGRDLRSSPRSVGVTRTRDGGGIVVEEKRASEAPRVAPAPAAAATVLRAPEAPRKTVSLDETISADGAASMESGDPLAEADFHMAYGLYDQAADLVQLAMKREPTRRDLKLKLLEIFFVWGNKDRFLQIAAEMNATRMEAPVGEWDKILIMGKQIAPNDAMFAGTARTSDDALDLELHGQTSTLDIDLMTAADEPKPDLDVGEAAVSRADTSGIDFILDEPIRGADDDSSTGPTVETPQVRRGEDTAELPVESLGLEVNSVRAIEALDAPDTIVTNQRPKPRQTAIETATGVVVVDSDKDLDVDLDMLSSTAMIRMGDDTAQALRAAAEDTTEEGILDLTESTGALPELDLSDVTGALPELDPADMADATGVMPMVDEAELSGQMHPNVDYDLGGEPATMSEVGTKLDLARAYMDMGDPEGARSILDEVLEEGSSTQRQEAERLIAALP